MSTTKQDNLTMKTLLFFFIPLGISASLVTLSHIIINSTLARTENSEVVIASYAIAISLFGITERLAVILRQTCTTLVRDQESFRKMSIFTSYIILSLLGVSMLIAYTPIGDFVFSTIFGASDDMVKQIKGIYQVLIFVTIFSGLRCLAQGIIIYNRQTKWLTIGMVVRLAAMYGLSLYFIQTGHISGKTGAFVFLVGMMIECMVSVIEARALARKMPTTSTTDKIHSKSEIFRFYSPLMLSSIITVLIGPITNIFLGKTVDIALAIASFTIALSITHLFLSFFSYTHQIVINFYKNHRDKVKRFTMMISLIPFITLSAFCFTDIGRYMMEQYMGVTGRLLDASLDTLKVFLIMAIVFPLVDFFNGVLMIQKQTKVTIISQSANLIMTTIILTLGITFASGWNGVIGALAVSIGLFIELIVVVFIVNRTAIKKNRMKINQSLGL
ncbi:O-antigen/teichoic acid export membrane protein [Bacillus mesophilus]|uniref:multi antimicrobial extrusion protein MatE n=1 Tax=Bacillus mesophilus TaxID=1808955 RepID=UPI00195ED336|nr:multi antimicrobial extrusion protein MatE [Bacillus mesophilus]MBM7663010.1 O-antigen/teichoic acid export membrane protein [Bacillus mesophilus]